MSYLESLKAASGAPYVYQGNYNGKENPVPKRLPISHFAKADDNAARRVYGVPEDAPLYYEPKRLAYGNYNNTTTIERANAEVFLAEFGELDGVHEFSGSYGYTGVLIREDAVTEEMAEKLDALDGYPVLDEDHLHELETRLQEEATPQFVADFWSELETRALVRVRSDVPEERIYAILDDFSEEQRREVFERASVESDTYWVHEDPFSAWIDVSGALEGVDVDELIEPAL